MAADGSKGSGERNFGEIIAAEEGVVADLRDALFHGHGFNALDEILPGGGGFLDPGGDGDEFIGVILHGARAGDGEGGGSGVVGPGHILTACAANDGGIAPGGRKECVIAIAADGDVVSGVCGATVVYGGEGRTAAEGIGTDGSEGVRQVCAL